MVGALRWTGPRVEMESVMMTEQRRKRGTQLMMSMLLLRIGVKTKPQKAMMMALLEAKTAPVSLAMLCRP